MLNQNLVKLIKEHALQYGDFKLSSGACSSYFIDMSKLTNQSEGLDVITSEILMRLGRVGTDLDAIGGPALGAAPLIGGTLINYRRDSFGVAKNLRGFLVRKEPKDGHWIEGNLQINDKVLILEDVVTTGNQTLKAIQKTEEFGAKVVGVMAVVDRLSGAKELLKQWNYQSLLTIDDILKPCQTTC
jgi:orotate phosphoribosyltransferase